MTVHAGELRLSTQGGGEEVDITDGVGAVVAQSGVELGVVTVFVPGSTAAIAIGGGPPAGPSETVPVRDGKLELGARQRIVLVDRGDGPRERAVLVRVID